jgi:hypothetical protein
MFPGSALAEMPFMADGALVIPFQGVMIAGHFLYKCKAAFFCVTVVGLLAS